MTSGKKFFDEFDWKESLWKFPSQKKFKEVDVFCSSSSPFSNENASGRRVCLFGEKQLLDTSTSK